MYKVTLPVTLLLLLILVSVQSKREEWNGDMEA